MVPVMCLGLVPAMFSKKNCGRIILDAFLLSLPCLLYAAYYVLFLKGQIVSLTIG